MTPSQARSFLAVAQKGSFSEAARLLGVSQPTVTSQVRQIERGHEVELFYRSGRGATLTAAGKSLLPFVQRMFGSFDEALAFLDERRGMRRGQLRLGSYGPYDVMRLVARFATVFPAVEISVEFHNSQSLANKLLNYELDVAVLGRIGQQPKFYALPFRNPPLVVIAPRTAPWLGRKSVTVAELAGQTLVCREPGSAARTAYDRLLTRNKVSPGRTVQFASREGVVNAVAEGVGVGTIFDEGILPGERVMKLKIAGQTVHSRVEIVCLSDRRTNKLISNFLDVARSTLRNANQERIDR